MWGDVKRPTFSPFSVSREAINEQVEPFPLVPATWIVSVFKCGLPKELSKWLTFSSPGL